MSTDSVYVSKAIVVVVKIMFYVDTSLDHVAAGIKVLRMP